MAKVNTYPSATVEDADLILGWDDSAARVIAPALSAWRAALITGAASTIATAALTASRALASDGTGKVAVSAVTATELGYLSGVTSALQTQINSINTRPVINLLANGNFDLWDLGTSLTPADNGYFAPGWRYLGDFTSGNAASRQTASVPSGSRYYARVTATKNLATWAGALFVIRSEDAIPLRGKAVTLQFQAALNSGTVLYAAIMAWTGTADAATSDPISAWAATPTLIANWTLENTPANLNGTTSFATYSIPNILLDTAGLNNIGVLIYTTAGSVGAATAQLDITQVQLHVGASAVDFVRRPIEQERGLVARSNYEATAAPGTGDDIADGYALGSQWINVTADDHYVCLDPAAGAAVWKKTTP